MVLPCLMEINPLNDEGTGMMLPCPLYLEKGRLS